MEMTDQDWSGVLMAAAILGPILIRWLRSPRAPPMSREARAEIRSEWAWLAFQFTISVIVGCYVFAHEQRVAPLSRGNLLAGLVCGFLATRAVMFLITWARFGWTAARSMRMG